MKMRLFFLVGVFSIFSAQALAFCVSPTAPNSPGIFSKPDVPYCLRTMRWNSKHSCDEWQISRYFDDVNDYIRGLSSYLDEVNFFAEQAFRYAKCEADEVRDQHK